MILQYCLRLRLMQGRHVDLSIMLALRERCNKARSEVYDEKGGRADNPIRKRFDELLARRIDPMQVLDQHNRRRIPRA